MINVIVRIGIAFAAGLALIAGATACGGSDGESSLENYLQDVEKLSDDLGKDGSAIEDDIDFEDPDSIRDGFGKFRDAADDFVRKIDGWDPPAEAQDAHEAVVDAGRETVSAIEEFIDDLEGVDSAEELASLSDAGLGEASERFVAACVRLQEVADDNEIDVALQCDE